MVHRAEITARPSSDAHSQRDRSNPVPRRLSAPRPYRLRSLSRASFVQFSIRGEQRRARAERRRRARPLCARRPLPLPSASLIPCPRHPRDRVCLCAATLAPTHGVAGHSIGERSSQSPSRLRRGCATVQKHAPGRAQGRVAGGREEQFCPARRQGTSPQPDPHYVVKASPPQRTRDSPKDTRLPKGHASPQRTRGRCRARG